MSKTCYFSPVPLVDKEMEETMPKLPWWLNLLFKILLVDLIIALFAVVWSWLTKDFGMVSLSNRFFLGGVVAALISVAAGLGNYENRSDGKQLFAQSAGQASLTERNNRMLADLAQVYALAFVMIPAAVIAILIAALLGQFA